MKKIKIVIKNPDALAELGKSKTIFLDKNIFISNKNSTCGFLISRQTDSSNYRSFEKFQTNPKKILKKSDRKPLIKRYIECMGLNNLVTKMGSEYFGSNEDVEMLKNSHFDLEYKFEDKGKIKRILVMGDKKAA